MFPQERLRLIRDFMGCRIKENEAAISAAKAEPNYFAGTGAEVGFPPLKLNSTFGGASAPALDLK